MTGRAETPPPLHFRKMHGLGNDFVIIDQRAGEWPLNAELVRAIGDRHRGVGFDQLAEIRPGGNVAADLIFWNSDGSTAGACGNATRCVADLLMSESSTKALSLRTERGVLPCARMDGGLISVDMGAPMLDWADIPLAHAVDTTALPLDGAPAACSMGNPHCTFFVEDAEAVDLAAQGAAIETDALFPERTNVQFVQVLSRTEARVRVWERGVGVTLASGSSSCAVVVNAVRKGLMDRSAVLHLDGGEIRIIWAENGHVLMEGPVSYVFEGVFDPRFVTP
ncbi:MAG: diaminopimelate epimerase [Pseudomonadota bacterium]